MLTTGGASANPAWAAAPGSGTVTSIATNNGVTGGTITTTGTIGLAAIANLDLLANISGSSAAPSANTLSAILDAVFDNTQGDILYRGSSGWTYLGIGTSGYVLTSQGAAANPHWAAASSGSPGGSTQAIQYNAGSSTFGGVGPGNDGTAPVWEGGNAVAGINAGVNFIAPTVASFAWVNQNSGSTTQTISGGPILMALPNLSGLNWQGLFLSPPSAPYKVRALVRANNPIPSGTAAAGLYFYDGTKLEGFEFLAVASYLPRVERMTNVTTASATVYTGVSPSGTSPWYSPLWIQLRNDGTDIWFDYSTDGINFINVYDEAVGTFITPTKIGFGGVNLTPTTNTLYINLLRWVVYADATLDGQ